jgi:hypothetical protein
LLSHSAAKAADATPEEAVELAYETGGVAAVEEFYEAAQADLVAAHAAAAEHAVRAAAAHARMRAARVKLVKWETDAAAAATQRAEAAELQAATRSAQLATLSAEHGKVVVRHVAAMDVALEQIQTVLDDGPRTNERLPVDAKVADDGALLVTHAAAVADKTGAETRLASVERELHTTQGNRERSLARGAQLSEEQYATSEVGQKALAGHKAYVVRANVIISQLLAERDALTTVTMDDTRGAAHGGV